MKDLDLRKKTHRIIDYFEKRGTENPVSLSQMKTDFADMGITGNPRNWIYPARRFMEKHRGNTIVRIEKGVYQLGDKAADNFWETERHKQKSLRESEASVLTSRTIKIEDFLPENQLIIQAYLISIKQNNEAIEFHYRQNAETINKLQSLFGNRENKEKSGKDETKEKVG